MRISHLSHRLLTTLALSAVLGVVGTLDAQAVVPTGSVAAPQPNTGAAQFAIPTAAPSAVVPTSVTTPTAEGVPAVAGAAVSVAAQDAAGPRLSVVRAGIEPRAEAALSVNAAATAAQQKPHVGQNVALMIVGGAALITGLVIGDDAGTLIAIGGTAVGLVGLYGYLK